MRWALLSLTLALSAGCLPVKGWTPSPSPAPKPSPPVVADPCDEYGQRLAVILDVAASKAEAGEFPNNTKVLDWIEGETKAARKEAFKDFNSRLDAIAFEGGKWTKEQAAKALRAGSAELKRATP